MLAVVDPPSLVAGSGGGTAASAASAAASRTERLHVIADGGQDCSRCRTVDGCWVKNTPRDDAIVVNLLACRIQRGLARNASTRLLLGLLRGKLVKIARNLARRTGESIEDLVADAESKVVSVVLEKYVFGEHAPLLVYLFDHRHGALTRWAYHRTRDLATYRSRYVSYDSNDSEIERRVAQLNVALTDERIRSGPPALVADAESPLETVLDNRLGRASTVAWAIDDGRTLTSTEYRVLRFCLDAPEDGSGAFQTYLARRLGVTRSVVTRLYGVAYRRVLEAAGLRDAYLAARGLVSRRLLGPLTGEETADLVLSAATSLDLAFAYRLNDVNVRKLRRRYKGMDRTTIINTVEGIL